MRNTIDEIALTNIKQETKYFRDFVQFPKQKYSPFSASSICSFHIPLRI